MYPPVTREPGVGGDDDVVLPGDGHHGPAVVGVRAEPPLGHPVVVVAQAPGLGGDLLNAKGLHVRRYLQVNHGSSNLNLS